MDKSGGKLDKKKVQRIGTTNIETSDQLASCHRMPEQTVPHRRMQVQALYRTTDTEAAANRQCSVGPNQDLDRVRHCSCRGSQQNERIGDGPDAGNADQTSTTTTTTNKYKYKKKKNSTIS